MAQKTAEMEPWPEPSLDSSLVLTRRNAPPQQILGSLSGSCFLFSVDQNAYHKVFVITKKTPKKQTQKPNKVDANAVFIIVTVLLFLILVSN